MKAVICKAYGSTDVLEIREFPLPTPNNNEILVKVHATTVTPGDYRMRSFTVPRLFWIPARFALGLTKPKNNILGFELSGVVESIGRDVTRFKVGDAVYASTYDVNFGGHAEYKCLPEDVTVALKPANLSVEQATAIPFGGITALNFLHTVESKSGQKILINGASGAVGTYAVQLANHYGMDVTAVCSGKNAELVKSLGAHQVIDYTHEDFRNNGEMYDVFFDAIGKTTLSQVWRSIKPNGIYLHTVMFIPGLADIWHSKRRGVRIVGGTPAGPANPLIVLKELIEAGTIKPIIDRTYRLDEIADAYHYVETGHKVGNVVIKVVNEGESS